MKLLGRILLAFSAIVLAVGAWIHTSAFNKVSAVVAKSDLDPFVGKGFKVLWFQDSTIAIVLAIVFAMVAIRPFAASRIIIVLLGLVPVITAAPAYHFIGNFVGGTFFDGWRHRNLGRASVSAKERTLMKQRSACTYVPSSARILCNFFSFGSLRKL